MNALTAGAGGCANAAQEPRTEMDMKTSYLMVAFVLACLVVAAPVGAQSPTPVGIWLHANGRIQVAIAPCSDRLCGKIVWLKRPDDASGRPLVDFKNPNPALRARPLLGLTVLQGLRRTGERTWEDGQIYNPDDGTDYRALMSIQDNGDLLVRAYLLLPMLGKTQIWTRVS
jgi:uncharacterized protein (DUF2147 family)